MKEAKGLFLILRRVLIGPMNPTADEQRLFSDEPPGSAQMHVYQKAWAVAHVLNIMAFFLLGLAWLNTHLWMSLFIGTVAAVVQTLSLSVSVRLWDHTGRNKPTWLMLLNVLTLVYIVAGCLLRV